MGQTMMFCAPPGETFPRIDSRFMLLTCGQKKLTLDFVLVFPTKSAPSIVQNLSYQLYPGSGECYWVLFQPFFYLHLQPSAFPEPLLDQPMCVQPDQASLQAPASIAIRYIEQKILAHSMSPTVILIRHAQGLHTETFKCSRSLMSLWLMARCTGLLCA